MMKVITQRQRKFTIEQATKTTQMEKGFELNDEKNNDNRHKERVGFKLGDERDVNDLHMHKEEKEFRGE